MTPKQPTMIPQDIHFEAPAFIPMLVVLSGLSGVGKDSVLRALKKEYPQAHYIVTFTDRKPRPGEIDGVDYYFVSTEEFERKIAHDEMAEYSKVYGQYKGGEKKQILQAFAEKKDVIMRLDVQGAEKIKAKYPDTLLIFITAENDQEWRSRLLNRNTETPEQMAIRLKTAQEELKAIPSFDYQVVNPENRLEEAVQTILSIFQAEHCRVQPRQVSL